VCLLSHLSDLCIQSTIHSQSKDKRGSQRVSGTEPALWLPWVELLMILFGNLLSLASEGQVSSSSHTLLVVFHSRDLSRDIINDNGRYLDESNWW
jgi:hypothetical protein